MRTFLLACALCNGITLASVGDFVAAGLGLSSSTASTSITSSLSSNSSLWRNSTSSSQRLPSSSTLQATSNSEYSQTESTSSSVVISVSSTSEAANDGFPSDTSNSSSEDTTYSSAPISTSAVPSNVSSSHSPASRSNTTSFYAGGTGSAYVYSNSTSPTASLTVTSALSGDCIAQWGEYWLAGPRSTVTTIYGSTETFTDAETVYHLGETSWLTAVSSAITDITTEVETAYDGPNRVVSTYTTTKTLIQSAQSWYSYSIDSGTTVSTFRTTDIGTITEESFPTLYWDQAYPKPTCAFPAGVASDCQAEWVTYIANDQLWYANSYTKPACSQASITGAPCNSLISAYFSNWTLYGQMTNPGYVSVSGSYSWPSTTTFAPGCTLGCQTCAITGETVQLYYWPPATAGTGAAFINGNGTATALAPIINSANASGPIVASVDGTLLTYPTNYVSYDKLYASDSCSGIGKTYYNTIVPLANNDQLSSMELRWVEDIAWHYETLSFDYNDLKEPVPESIYDKQPRCWESSMAWDEEGMIQEYGPFTCPRIGPYAPIIAVPAAVTNLDPQWKSCTAWYGGLYDPPKALQPTAVAAGVTSAYVVSSTSASPGSTATDPGPTQTTPLQQTTTMPAPAGASSTGIQDPPTGSQAQSTHDTQSSAISSADPSDPEPTTDAAQSSAKSSASAPNPASTTDDPPSPGASTPLSDPQESKPASTTVDSPDPGANTPVPEPQEPNTASDPSSQAQSFGTDPAGTGGTTTSAISVADPSSSDPDPIYSAIAHVASSSAGADESTSADPMNLFSVIEHAATSSRVAASAPADPSDPGVTNPVTLTVGTHGVVVTANPIGSQSVAVAVSGIYTILTTGQAATIAGHTFSMGASYIQVDGFSTAAFPVASAAAGSEPQDPTVIATASDGRPISAYASSGSVIVQAGTSAVTLAQGQATVIAGQTVSAASGGVGGVVVNGHTTMTLAKSDPSDPASEVQTAASGAQGQIITASPVNGAILIGDGSSTITLQAGQRMTFDGRVLSAPASASYVVVDGSTTLLSDPPTGTPDSHGLTIAGAQGQMVQLSYSGADLIAADGSSSATLTPGQVGTFDGRTISVPSSGSLVVVDGTRTLDIQSETSSIAGAVEATITGTNGQSIVLVDQPNGNLKVMDSSSTVTLSAGQATTFDGQTISAGNGGTEVVVDGSLTLTLTPSRSGTLSAGNLVVTGSQTSASDGQASTGGALPRTRRTAMTPLLMAVILAMWLRLGG